MMTKDRANELHSKLNALLKQFAAENDLSFSGVKSSFSADGWLKTGCSFSPKSVTGDDVNPEFLRNLQRNGFMYGLDVSLIGKTINVGAKQGMKFQGLRGKKAVLKDRDGKNWLYDAMLVAQLLKVAK